MGDITQNFSYSEFKVSSSYPQLAEQIILTKADKVKMHWMSHIVLQPLRNLINEGVSDVQSQIPIHITSGIRSGALNTAVGGVATSDHMYKKLSCACDLIIGENTKFYLEIAKDFCYTVRRYIKQFIFYLPQTDDQGRQRGNFIHLSMLDGTKKTWDVLYCASRGARQYFRTYQEAEDYMRRE